VPVFTGKNTNTLETCVPILRWILAHETLDGFLSRDYGGIMGEKRTR